MLTLHSFDYAVLRIVPRVEREEFLNAGVILLCLKQDFLAARVQARNEQLQALWPEVDAELVRSHLEGIAKICQGDQSAGPISRLSRRERFHWLVAPRSAMIQVSPVHSGLCNDAAAKLEQLFKQLV